MTQLVTALALALHATVPSVNVDRVGAITEDIFAVVETESHSEKGLRMDSETAVALLAAAIVNESGLKESVEKCSTNGDGGRSVGLGQVMRGRNWEGHTRSEICSSRTLQLTLALHVLNRCWAQTPRADATFRCYVAGNAAIHSDAAKRELKTYLKYKKTLSDAKARPEEPAAQACVERPGKKCST